eukprot:TRINITY_DN15045_c0_g1_i2.p1 TRINITY_DN15045_c0_g1~~TRINITY_DN15045_c0_g1_i2.p1  ORF type:complete len:142 (-),score=16.27 TRINITY_DN15045_c0_g1_i2:51-476(-)
MSRVVRSATSDGNVQGRSQKLQATDNAAEDLVRKALRLPVEPARKEDDVSQVFKPGGPFDPCAGDAAEDEDLFNLEKTGPLDAKGPRLIAAIVLLLAMWLYIARYMYECVYLSGGYNTPGTWCAWSTRAWLESLWNQLNQH